MDQDSPQAPISEATVAPAVAGDAIIENDNRDSKKVLKQQAPNKETKISSVVNGAFNGLSVAAIPASGVAVWAELQEGKISKGKVIATAIGTVALAGIGGIWGLAEAKRLKTYRDAIADEVGRLEDRLECLERLHAKSHVQRGEDRKQSPSTPQIS